MAVPTQVISDYAGISLVALDEGDLVYGFQVGSIRIGMGTGSPDNELNVAQWPQGSKFTDKATGREWIKDDTDATSWTASIA